MFKKSRRRIVAAIMSVLVLLWVGTLGLIYASSYYEMAENNREMLKFHADMYDTTQGNRQPIDDIPQDGAGQFGGIEPNVGAAQTPEVTGPANMTPPEGEAVPDNGAGQFGGIEPQPPETNGSEGMTPPDNGAGQPGGTDPNGGIGQLPDSGDSMMKPRPDDGNHRLENSPMFRLSTFYSVAVSDSGDVMEIRNDQQELHTDSELEAMAKSIIAAGKTDGTAKDLVFYMAKKDGYTLVTFMDNTIINESAATLFRFTLIFGGVAMVVFFFLAMFLARRIVDPLEESYRRQKQFISDAGHELKTPVSVVNTNAELLSRQIGENRWLENIRYENERMGLLVGQLLELAHTESVTPQMEKLDFSRLCQGEALPHESVAFEQGLSLKLDITEDVTVMGNGTQLRQLVSILLDNAIRHSTGGEVSLTLSRDRGYARLAVVNEGEEIPEEQRERLFERFYRVDTARNGEGKHYGLGLAIAKSIVQSHKGKIEVGCRDGLVELAVRIPCIDK